MNKQNTKPKKKQTHKPRPDVKKLADVLDIEFKKIVPLIPLPDGSVAYKNYIVKKNKAGSWCIYSKQTTNYSHGEFNLQTCALVAAKALAQMQLQRYNEIKSLDNKYWSNFYRTSVYQHNIKLAKDYDRYLILLNKLEDSTWKANHYKEEISKLFRWAFV
jgi:hypothetical protein